MDQILRRYGSYALHTKYCHEQAVRIVLAAVERAAARHKRYITPVLSASVDFYVRAFVRVHTSAVRGHRPAAPLPLR